MKKLHLISLSIVIACMPQLAFAQEQLNWKVHGLTGLTIGIVGGIIWVKLNKSLESKHAKVMGFGIYFWVLIFVQAILYGLMFGLTK